MLHHIGPEDILGRLNGWDPNQPFGRGRVTRRRRTLGGMTGDAFAPTSIDRMVERLQRSTPLLARVSDGAFVLFALLLSGFDLMVTFSRYPTDLRFDRLLELAVLGLSLVAVGAVALRRRYCIPGLVVVSATTMALTATSAVTGIALPPSFTALYALALLSAHALHSEPGGPAVAATGLAAIAILGEPARMQTAGTLVVQAMCLACFGVAVAAGMYLRWSAWRRVAGEEAARNDERLEIARELHDLVGHYVTGMVVQAQAGQHVARNDPDAAVAALHRIELAGADAMTAMRRMIGGLREDATITPGVGWEEIESLRDAAVRDGLPLRLTIDPDARTVPIELTASVHRILAESLTNVRRHARDVTRVDATVELDGVGAGAQLVVRVHDDGTGAPPSTHDTYGLVGMRERAESLGGTLFAGPAPSGGWLVHAVIPVEAAAR